MKKQKILMNLANIFTVILVIVMLFPIVWIMLNSFKPGSEIFAQPITLLPKKFTVEAYTKYLVSNNIFKGYLNSFIVATGALVIGLVLGVTSAYGLARFRMRGSKLIILLFLLTQMLPASLMLTPMYLTYSKLKILNTYIAPIISVATISIPFVVVTTRPFFLGLPKELDDAARIDGCNAFTSFLKIMLPIARPGVITAGALSFIFGWNDLVYNMTFNTKPEMRPLTAIMYNLMPKEGVKWNGVMALATVSILPIIFMFVILQDFIVGGLAAGAVKE